MDMKSVCVRFLNLASDSPFQYGFFLLIFYTLLIRRKGDTGYLKKLLFLKIVGFY